MSVSLNEVLTAAGYDIKNNPEDAQWLLAQKDEFEELLEIAEQTVDDYDEYEDYLDDYDEYEDYLDDYDEYEDYLDGLDDDDHQAEMSFDEWKESK